MGKLVFESKKDLYNSYFSDFYKFMKKKTNVSFEQYGIKSKKDFLDFCSDWNANDNHSFYGVGDAFSKYYVEINIDSRLEDQSSEFFIGYCYENDMYLEFIPFLMNFFEYWRTDEGYTGGKDDPDNTGSDFFAHAWASLVDTCKFFHFTSDNLNDTYPWFQSERVKDALDNIPNVKK